MKKNTLLAIFFISSICFSQIAWASSEELAILSGKYFEMGSTNVPHLMTNTSEKPFANSARLLGDVEQNSNPFSIYPNPATNGYVNIVSKSASAEPKEIFIFDVLGKEIIKTILKNDRLDISALKSGIYILKVIQGQTTVTKKLIIK